MVYRGFLILIAFLFATLQGYAQGGEYESLAHGILAAYLKTAPAPKPSPGPAPAPVSDVCPNCNGKGWTGDGVTKFKCDDCNGTGKVKKSGEVYPPSTVYEGPSWPDYPTSTGDPNRHATRWHGLSSWEHLTKGDHAGAFDTDWLKTLTLAELHALHDDHHEELTGRGRVKWENVIRGTANAATSPAAPRRSASPSFYGGGIFSRLLNRASGGCPGGVCPN
jgi:hypothetical protein